jgi:hypothetical protein
VIRTGAKRANTGTPHAAADAERRPRSFVPRSLGFAIDEFQAMKMQPALEGALSYKAAESRTTARYNVVP